MKLVAVGGIGTRSARRLILLRLLVHSANASRQHECSGRRRLKNRGLEECVREASSLVGLELTLAAGCDQGQEATGARRYLILGMYRYILGICLCIRDNAEAGYGTSLRALLFRRPSRWLYWLRYGGEGDGANRTAPDEDEDVTESARE